MRLFTAASQKPNIFYFCIITPQIYIRGIDPVGVVGVCTAGWELFLRNRNATKWYSAMGSQPRGPPVDVNYHFITYQWWNVTYCEFIYDFDCISFFFSCCCFVPNQFDFCAAGLQFLDYYYLYWKNKLLNVVFFFRRSEYTLYCSLLCWKIN